MFDLGNILFQRIDNLRPNFGLQLLSFGPNKQWSWSREGMSLALFPIKLDRLEGDGVHLLFDLVALPEPSMSLFTERDAANVGPGALFGGTL